jgi:hypothetical protein
MTATGPNPVPTIVLNLSDDLPDFHAHTLNEMPSNGNDQLAAKVKDEPRWGCDSHFTTNAKGVV